MAEHITNAFNSLCQDLQKRGFNSEMIYLFLNRSLSEKEMIEELRKMLRNREYYEKATRRIKTELAINRMIGKEL